VCRAGALLGLTAPTRANSLGRHGSRHTNGPANRPGEQTGDPTGKRSNPDFTKASNTMMNDPKDPFALTRTKVFLYGAGVTAVLAGLAWLYVPASPLSRAVSAPLTGPGSQSAALSGEPAASTGSAPTAQSPAELIAQNNGPEALYSRFCTQCHGDDGLGNTMMARMMTAKVPNLVTGPWQVARTPEAVSQLILKGSESKAMPGFERELGSEKARALADYVLTFPDVKKPQAK